MQLSLDIVSLACRASLGVLFAIGGVGKAIQIDEFHKVLDAYRIIPPKATRIAAVALTMCEICTATAMTVDRLVRPFSLIAVGLLLLFCYAIAANLARGRSNLPCGCFGQAVHSLRWRLVWRDMAFILMSLIAGRYVRGVALWVAALSMMTLLLFASVDMSRFVPRVLKAVRP